MTESVFIGEMLAGIVLTLLCMGLAIAAMKGSVR